MPKVITKTKSNRGKPYGCVSCTNKIVSGEKYFEWTFYHQPAKRQHMSHGHPKQSQLTQSKMADAYSAIEGMEADVLAAETIEDIKDALESCKSEIESVRDSYQEGFDNMPQGLQDSDTGSQSTEKIEALEEFINEIESLDIEEFEDEEPDQEKDPDAHADWEKRRDEHLEDQKLKTQDFSLNV